MSQLGVGASEPEPSHSSKVEHLRAIFPSWEAEAIDDVLSCVGGDESRALERRFAECYVNQTATCNFSAALLPASLPLQLCAARDDLFCVDEADLGLPRCFQKD